MTNVTPAQFEFLRSIDTPTVCNLLEVVAPERRGFGYTVRHLHCPFPDLPPMVGFAKTVTMRAQDRVPLGEAGYMNKRLDYLDYVASQPQPGIAVIQDLDDIVGFGATSRRSRRASRCWPARSRRRTPSSMWWISAAT